MLAGDLSSPQIDGLKVFADATDKIAKVGDGDDFFAVGAHIALDPEHGGLLSEMLPLLHIGSSSPEASATRWLLDQLVKEVATDLPGRTVGVKTTRAAFVYSDHPLLSCDLRT